MTYKVINSFYDKENNNEQYLVGDSYPRGDYQPTDERIEALSTQHPKYQKVFIEKVNSEEIYEDPKLSLSISDLRKMNKGPQEELIVELGGDPTGTNNEEERIKLIVQLQEQKQAENN